MSFDARDDLQQAESRIAELTKALGDLVDCYLKAAFAGSAPAVVGMFDAARTGQETLQGGYCRMTCRDGDDCGCPCHEEE